MFEVLRFADLKHLPWYVSEHGGERGAGWGLGGQRKGWTSPPPSRRGRGIMLLHAEWEDVGAALGWFLDRAQGGDRCISALRTAFLWREALKSDLGPWRALC